MRFAPFLGVDKSIPESTQAQLRSIPGGRSLRTLSGQVVVPPAGNQH